MLRTASDTTGIEVNQVEKFSILGEIRFQRRCGAH